MHCPALCLVSPLVGLSLASHSTCTTPGMCQWGMRCPGSCCCSQDQRPEGRVQAGGPLATDPSLGCRAMKSVLVLPTEGPSVALARRSTAPVPACRGGCRQHPARERRTTGSNPGPPAQRCAMEGGPTAARRGCQAGGRGPGCATRGQAVRRRCPARQGTSLWALRAP